MESTQISVLIALGAGLLSFISPCVLPLFPAYLSFITGMSATTLHDAIALRPQRLKPGSNQTVILSKRLFHHAIDIIPPG